MEKYKNFVVYGPGRTGSHWVESIMVGLFSQVHYRSNQCCVLSDRWIYHTNEIIDLIDIPIGMRDSITLIVCDRANDFDRTISYITATYTTEFYFYTDKIIEPFRVDLDYFNNMLKDYRVYLDQFNCIVLPLYNNVIRIDYDALVSAAVPGQYIADQLGINYVTNLGYQSGSVKNPRNYKDLILNWEELHQIYQESLVDK